MSQTLRKPKRKYKKPFRSNFIGVAKKLKPIKCHKCRVEIKRNSAPQKYCLLCRVVVGRLYLRNPSSNYYRKNLKLSRARGMAGYWKHLEKNKIRNKTRWLVQKGVIKKQKCFCGEVKVQAHHYKGYGIENVMDIKWLCSKHHAEEHHDSPELVKHKSMLERLEDKPDAS